MKTTTGRLGLNLLIWAGAALLAASAVLHFQLWDSEGYRHIPTIGPLFLAQAIVGVVLAIATAIFRRLILVAASAGLAISSIGGLLIAIWFGLFGWQETASAPYVGMAFTIEAIAAALLGGATVLMAWSWLSRMSAAPVMKPRRGPAVAADGGVYSLQRANSKRPSRGREQPRRQQPEPAS